VRTDDRIGASVSWLELTGSKWVVWMKIAFIIYSSRVNMEVKLTGVSISVIGLTALTVGIISASVSWLELSAFHPMGSGHPVREDIFISSASVSWFELSALSLNQNTALQKLDHQLRSFFAKEPYKTDYILQKRLTILRSLQIIEPTHCASETRASIGIIFRKRSTNLRALLRKMTYEDRAPYNTTTFLNGKLM